MDHNVSRSETPSQPNSERDFFNLRRNQRDVEKILNHRMVDGVYHFLVKWVGFAAEDATWERARRVHGYEEQIAEYFAEYRRAHQFDPKPQVVSFLPSAKKKRRVIEQPPSRVPTPEPEPESEHSDTVPFAWDADMDSDEGVVTEVLDGMKRDGSVIYIVQYPNGTVSTATREWVIGNAPDKLMQFLETALGYDE
jgi:hypothetical protein